MAKEHNATFMRAYDTGWDGLHYIGAYVARQAFGRHRTDTLPVTDNPLYTEVTNDAGTVTLAFILLPSNIRGCRRHRVMTVCGKCWRAIPVGRIHQHKC